MKKLIAMLLIAVMVMSFAACGYINKTEVAILWAGDGIVKVPSSLSNAMERAMYIESIQYKHYGANGDQAVQTQQALDALNAGCSGLVVELVDATAAQTIVDAAKEKGVPVVLLSSSVDAAVVNSYDKCISVDTDAASLPKVQGDQIFRALVDEKKGEYLKGIDRNGDGKISYFAIGEVAATVEVINAKLAEKSLPALEAVTGKLNTIIGQFREDSAPVELIITTDDADAMELLMMLQAKGYNKDRLSTHCIPVFTVGDKADYKVHVLAGKPEGAHTDDHVQEYYKMQQYLVDLRTIEESHLEEMIYTTASVIGDGRLAGTVVENYDELAVQTASVLAKLLTGKAVDNRFITIEFTVI
ncbi:MAG: substrate-binding domain-containing protein [Oscillospiraceae bacterium]|nr:substrate-binding domain-containing protein [Oscillospiraceae bacterium]